MFNEVKSKYKVDKDVCYRLEWGGELAKLGNKLDAVSTLTLIIMDWDF